MVGALPKIRRAATPDLDSVRELLVETWHATYDSIYGRDRVKRITDTWHSIEALRSRFDSPKSCFLVASSDGFTSLTGTAFATLDNAKCIQLHQLYVHPDSQGCGIGKRLLSAIVENFPHAERISLEAEPANKRAIEFYSKHGFEIVGEGYDCGGIDENIPHLVMEKKLQAGL